MIGFVLACLWSYGTALNGAEITVEGLGGAQLVRMLTEYQPRAFWETRKAGYADHRNPNRFVRNDHAVTLLHLGETDAAIAILLKLEREKPDYVTASNLGTAYELAGRNQDALRWIREAIARNPIAHQGTEWLHVRILEAKLAIAADPKWLANHSVLGIDFGTGAIPKMPVSFPTGNDGKADNAARTRDALWYQLEERYQFVQAPDPIVGNLLFDWANLMYRTETLESAVALYREAIRYGAPQIDLAKLRLQRAERILRDHQQRR